MSSCIVFTDQHAPDGRAIKYNVNQSTRAVAAEVAYAMQEGELLEIPNEKGGDPIFVHPDHVATVSPRQED